MVGIDDFREPGSKHNFNMATGGSSRSGGTGGGGTGGPYYKRK